MKSTYLKPGVWIAPSCGTRLQPCQSISAGVWRADNNAYVLIDGTGTQTSPYPCQSSALKLQGINTNKSLSLTGVQSTVNVKCRDGLEIRLNHSNINHDGTTINLTNIWFHGSPLSARDVNLQIDSCSFVNGASAVTLTQFTQSVTLTFTNSSCLNTSSCIIVDASKGRLQTSQGGLRIRLSNSNVTGTMISSPLFPSTASAIQVVSSDDNPLSLSCDIALQNAVFTDNQIGSQGVVNVLWYNGFLSLLFDNVSFFGNKFVSRGPPNIIATLSRNIKVLMNHANFSTSTLGRVMSLEATNSSIVCILDSSFTGEQFAPKGSVGLFYLDSEHLSEVFISNTTFTNIQTNGVGSCMSIKSGSAKVQIVNSTFTNNYAGCAGIFWMFVEETLVLAFQGCHFESNGAEAPGGLASCTGEVVNITMLDSKINGSHAEAHGGVFDIGLYACDRKSEVLSANLRFENVVIENCSCISSGGVAAMNSVNGSIIVRDSLFRDISAEAPGGVFYSVLWARNPSASLLIEITNTVFNNSSTMDPGGVIYAYRVRKLRLDRVIIDSATAQYGPGGGLHIQGDNMEVNITNSTFQNCKAGSPAGVMYLTGGKLLNLTISDSLFDSNVARGPGGCMYVIAIEQVYATFTNVTFRNCQTWSFPGGAVYVNTIRYNEIVFRSCVFRDNTVLENVGGALYTEFPKDNISDPGCIKDSSVQESTAPHRSWSYNSKVQMIDTFFVNNTAQSGGAMAVTRGQHVIKDCTFRNNFATLQGGHILSPSDSTSLLIYDTKFLQTRKTQVLNTADDKEKVSRFRCNIFHRYRQPRSFNIGRLPTRVQAVRRR